MERKLVIDISHWDGDIDLKAWRDKRGLWGVVIKAGGNEANLGRYTDSKFERNYAKAKAAGLHIGAYYYTVTCDVANAKKDAEHFAAHLTGKRFDLPVYMDVEDAKQFKLSKRLLTDVIKAFCDVMEGKGYRGGLYTGGSAWLNNMHREELYKYADWIAWWRGSWPTEAGDIGMWQQGGMRLSDGDIVYADKSGYTDLDWCVVDYPAKLGNSGGEEAAVAPKKKLSAPERIAQVAEHFAAHSVHGYSQPHRGTGSSESVKLSDGSKVTVSNSDLDCSEMARQCVNAALSGKHTSPIPDMWTGNEDQRLKAQGFTRMAFSTSKVKRGDVLWVKGHTGIALGNGRQADAHGDEYGGITGPNRGDQTGHEIEVRGLRSSWTYIYRYPTGTKSTAEDKLEVDGVGGASTVSAWQEALGTPVDGVIGGQYRPNHKYFEGITAVQFGTGGSALVRAAQRKVGASADGIWGSQTTKKLKAWLNGKVNAGLDANDAHFGPKSVKALQKSLNAGAWK